ncbi:MAG: DUF3887 domain-containing protein [Sarcina sp.]
MKKLIKGLMVCLPILFLVGCGGNSLSEKFDEEKLNIENKNVIEWLAEGQFEKVYEIEDTTMQASLDEDKLAEVFEPINQTVGTYKDIEKTVMKEKDGSVTGVSIANYENGKLQFTINFNEEMKIGGLYVK